MYSLRPCIRNRMAKASMRMLAAAALHRRRAPPASRRLHATPADRNANQAALPTAMNAPAANSAHVFSAETARLPATASHDAIVSGVSLVIRRPCPKATGIEEGVDAAS